MEISPVEGFRAKRDIRICVQLRELLGHLWDILDPMWVKRSRPEKQRSELAQNWQPRPPEGR